MDRIRISFWGTPDMAARILETIIRDERFEVGYTVTRKDKPRSARDRIVLPSPVKKLSLDNMIPVYEPESLRKEAENLIPLFRDSPVDFHLVFAYGQIIPASLFQIPPMEAVNLHGSLLPLLRGASPIEHALIHGFTKTGWTMQKIAEKMDAGDVLASSEVEILRDDTRDSLAERMLGNLEKNILPWLKAYAHHELQPIAQREENATYCGKITTEMGNLNWQNSSGDIINLYRAFTPKPGVFTFWNNKKVKISFALSVPASEYFPAGGKPGEILRVDQYLWVCTGDGKALPVSQLHPEGKKPMTARDFINGYGATPGQFFHYRNEGKRENRNEE